MMIEHYFNENEFEIKSLLIDELLSVKERRCKDQRFNIDWLPIVEESLSIISSLFAIGEISYSIWKKKKEKAIKDLQEANKIIGLTKEDAEEIIKKIYEFLKKTDSTQDKK